jgi:hypothetical protein
MFTVALQDTLAKENEGGGHFSLAARLAGAKKGASPSSNEGKSRRGRSNTDHTSSGGTSPGTRTISAPASSSSSGGKADPASSQSQSQSQSMNSMEPYARDLSTYSTPTNSFYNPRLTSGIMNVSVDYSSQMHRHGRYVIDGSFWKLCPSFPVIWQMRYFVLKPDGSIYYYYNVSSRISD